MKLNISNHKNLKMKKKEEEEGKKKLVNSAYAWEMCFRIWFQVGGHSLVVSLLREDLSPPITRLTAAPCSGSIVPAWLLHEKAFPGPIRRSAREAVLRADQTQNRKTTNKIQLEQVASIYFRQSMICHHGMYQTLAFPVGWTRSVSCDSSPGWLFG